VNLQVRKSIQEDIEHLQSCLDRDSSHKGQSAEQWKRSGVLVSFHGDIGPLYHICLQQTGTQRRIHFQHDPAISRRRMALAMAKGIKWLKVESKKEGVTELVFNSTAEPLINFFANFGFVAVGNEDYKADL
jgi:hypothetical protein